MKTIALFDFSGIFCRHWYARGADDMNDARLTTVAQIREMAADYDHAAICIDSPKSWRRDKYPAYKANRPPKEAVMIEQLRKCQQQLADDGFAILGAERYEADDVMATAAYHEGLAKHRITIVSADKDMLQCLGDGVDVLRPHTDPHTLVTVATLERDKGLTPEQIPHWLALMGDSSDNVPGVKRVGDKTACRLLGQFGDCNGVVAAAVNGDGMTKNGANAVLAADCDPDCPLSLALELVTLKTDAPIDVAGVLEPRQPKTTPMEDDMSEECDDCEDCDCPDAEPTQPSKREPEVIEAEPVSSSPKPTVALATRGAQQSITNGATWEMALEPNGMKQAVWFSKTVFESRLYSQFATWQQVLAVVIGGRSRGITSIQACESMNVIKGKATMPASLMHALCERHPACEYFRLVESNAERATYETKRRGHPEPVRLEWTADQAKKANLWGRGGWSSYPDAMLRARCIAALARAVYPDALHNTYTPEELES